ncbi:MAG: hypothetical protein OQK78_05220 [Gammaproteobacteria bacterium]|nr:hypothetical protein [Gammaproteobacteria bacterium]
MAQLPNSLRDWNTDAFEQSLKSEVERFRRDVLPLHDAIENLNSVVDNDLGVTFISATDNENAIHAKVGVYFAEAVSCCSCGESEPIEEAYCEMDITIDKSSGDAQFAVRPDYIKQ